MHIFFLLVTQGSIGIDDFPPVVGLCVNAHQGHEHENTICANAKGKHKRKVSFSLSDCCLTTHQSLHNRRRHMGMTGYPVCVCVWVREWDHFSGHFRSVNINIQYFGTRLNQWVPLLIKPIIQWKCPEFPVISTDAPTDPLFCFYFLVLVSKE